ncbi:MAG: apolipoprotein N-acyltransferase [Alphaproteobacteria bacterium]|nr:apolipoprotein N-acyltransferase [Alphaproteobacteria bacterium]
MLIINNIVNYYSLFLNNHPVISALLAGSLLKFSFNGCKYLGFICFILSFNILITILNIYLLNKNLKQSFIVGYSFGFTYFLFTISWITNSFTYVGLNIFYAYAALLLLVSLFSLYPAITCISTVYLSTNKFNLNIYFALLWTITEYLRSILFTGFPWNLVGYASYQFNYFIQIADIFGIFGVSFLLILIILLLRNKKQYIYGVVLLIASVLYGFYRVNIFNGYIIPNKTDNVILVHPSIKQSDKLNNQVFWNNIDLHIYLSSIDNLNKNNKTLIIWPEAAVNTVITDFIVKYLSSTVTNDNTLLLTGTDRIENNKAYNSAVVINNKNEIIKFYDKRHLVPFGEYIPNWINSIGLSKIASGEDSFYKGTYTNSININGYRPFDICICYEIIFPSQVMDSPHASEWILNITNDAWFDGRDEQYQHTVMTCFRAIEQGRAIARCNNNGVSAIIDCHGKIIKSLNPNITGYI